MNFLFIALHIQPAIGGAEISTLTLMNELRKRGHTCNHIDSNNWNEDVEGTAKHHDIIITQLQWAPKAIHIAERYNKPSIVMLHSLENTCRVVHDPVHAIELYRCQQKCSTCPHMITGYEEQGIALNKCNLILGNCKWNATWAIEELGYRPEKVGWVYPSMTEIDNESIKGKYISMNMLTYAKGTDIFADIARQMPNEKFRIYGYEHSLPCFPSFSLPKNVEFMGKVSQEEMYTDAKLWIVPARKIVNFGMTIIEAMSCGVPVIASGCGSVIDDEMVIDGYNGLHVPMDDWEKGHKPDLWVKYVNKALENIEEYSLNAHETDFSRFSKKASADRFIDYAKKLVH
tara:strand:- start:1838 stop:2869 length:1032 start_codon:yes stop_codon:yes gene_type:complete